MLVLGPQEELGAQISCVCMSRPIFSFLMKKLISLPPIPPSKSLNIYPFLANQRVREQISDNNDQIIGILDPRCYQKLILDIINLFFVIRRYSLGLFALTSSHALKQVLLEVCINLLTLGVRRLIQTSRSTCFRAWEDVRANNPKL